jgi:hypothetical protein
MASVAAATNFSCASLPPFAGDDEKARGSINDDVGDDDEDDDDACVKAPPLHDDHAAAAVGAARVVDARSTCWHTCRDSISSDVQCVSLIFMW